MYKLKLKTMHRQNTLEYYLQLIDRGIFYTLKPLYGGLFEDLDIPYTCIPELTNAKILERGYKQRGGYFEPYVKTKQGTYIGAEWELIINDSYGIITAKEVCGAYWSYIEENDTEFIDLELPVNYDFSDTTKFVYTIPKYERYTIKPNEVRTENDIDLILNKYSGSPTLLDISLLPSSAVLVFGKKNVDFSKINLVV